MWVRASADVSEVVTQLTTAVSNHAFVLGSAPTIIDTGVAAQSERLLEEVGGLLQVGEQLSQILLTNAHVDTVGALPFLRSQFPDAKLYAAPGVAELLQADDTCERLLQGNRDIAKAFDIELDIDTSEWKQSLQVDQVIRDGDTIAFDDGTEIKVIACPGYTDDGLGFFICPDGVLVPGTFGGMYGGRGLVAPCFSSSYQQYVETLDKLATLDLKCIVLPHAGALTGELAMRYLLQLREECEVFRERIREHLANGIIIEEVCDVLIPELVSDGLAPGGALLNQVRENITNMVSVVADGR